MKVLFFSLSYPTPWQPTAAAFNRTMIESLAGSHQVHVVAPVPWTQRFGRTAGTPSGEPARVPVEVTYPVYWYTPGVLRHRYAVFLWLSCREALRRAVARIQPDVLLAYWAHPDGAVMLRAAREAGRPGVVIAGGSDVLLLTEDADRRRAIERVLRNADAILTVGERLKGRVITLGAPAARVSSFQRGVDTAIFNPGDRAAARTRLGVAPSRRAALWVGRMVPVKGLDRLLDAWTRVSAGDATLYLVGDGPQRLPLEGHARRLGLGSRVAFVGAQPQPRLADWYRAADVTVLSSLSEGIPNVLLESLACGTPFVATDVGGVGEIPGDASCTLVPANDAMALADALERRLMAPARAAVPIASTAESAAALTRLLESAVAAYRIAGTRSGPC